MNDLQGWWNSVPPVTRFLFGFSMAITLGKGDDGRWLKSVATSF